MLVVASDPFERRQSNDIFVTRNVPRVADRGWHDLVTYSTVTGGGIMP
jgi:hypothetical protein